MSPQPGEVWLADLCLAAKTRPVVIVPRQDPDPPRALALYVPLTTQHRLSRYEVPLPKLHFLDWESVANGARCWLYTNGEAPAEDRRTA
jgi:mRNA interferase MazF